VSSNPKNSAQAIYDKCLALANNLWWSWHPEVINLFRSLDPQKWRESGHNPMALLKSFTPEELESRAGEMVLYTRIDQAHRRLKKYMSTTPKWAKKNAGVLGSKPVAYFSLEFGVHESIPIYSGGLGVLSGDHIKSASGLGVPLVAVGLFYDQGYFKQQLDANGWQEQDYTDTDVDNLPMEAALDADGNQITVCVPTLSGDLFAKVRKMKVGRVDLYLLDTDLEENSPEDRELTSRLYGGDNRTRIRQELIVGVGGMKALKALCITPGVFHLNEGHSAFATLEAARERMEEDGMSFEDAKHEVAKQTVFTTHTPVPAGHDRFDTGLIDEHLGPLRDSLGIDHDQLMGLGRVEPQNHDESFCMTVLGLKLSRSANAVSSLHGDVSRRMWKGLYRWSTEEHVPIGHITNGVHVPSWMSWQMMQLLERHYSDWRSESYEPDAWQAVYDIDPGELWETHCALKSLLLAFVRRRLVRQSERRGDSPETIEHAKSILEPRTLTIGCARRFATYKRATLFFSDPDRLDRIVNNPERPVQFIFAGKAHPADMPGKKLIQRIAQLRHDPRFKDRIVFIEDYDINVGRHLIQGVDVWLNNPRRPLEASGTSGQKAVLNGALNLSILDGWWAEAYNGSNGFAIGNGRCHVDMDVTDDRDGRSLYEVLENEVVPLFYNCDADDLPQGWIEHMKNSIATLAWRFSAHRMVSDYVLKTYLPAAGGISCEMGPR
jgi:glycogen phosphorylase